MLLIRPFPERPAATGTAWIPDVSSALLTIPDRWLRLGMAVCGAPGSGKTTFVARRALLGMLRGQGQVLLDPTGSLSTAFLHQLLLFLSEFAPKERRAFLRERLCYVPLGSDYTLPFPSYSGQDQGQSLGEVSERLLSLIRLSNPSLQSQAPVSYPSMHTVGLNTGILLAALGLQITECEDLLLNTLAWSQSGRFDAALRRYPQEAAGAVSYFRDHYLALSRSEKAKLRSLFLDQVAILLRTPSLRALFGARRPGIAWEEALEQIPRKTVILDCKLIRDPEAKRSVLLWILLGLLEHLQGRGRRQKPVGFIIDEFAAMCAKSAGGTNPLAELMDAFLAQYQRSNQVFFTCCFQSLDQLPPDLQHTILRLGTLVVGRIGTMREARVLADVLFQKDPMLIKHLRHAWGRTPYVRGVGGGEYFPLEEIPMYSPLPEQLETAAQTLTSLKLWEFLIRPTTREGEVSQSVEKITIRTVLEDPDTNEYVFPDETLIDRLKSHLAKRGGIPVATILKEQESRLIAHGTLQQGTTQALPPGEVAATPRTVTQRPPGNTTPPSPETAKAGLPPGRQKEISHTPPSQTGNLDDQQRAFLTFLMEHPDTPISAVYKQLSLSWYKGNELREYLSSLGYLSEIETRLGKGRRPMKFFIPTFSAFELLGVEPPTGRGGAVHRSIQELVCAGAAAKGYSTQVEKEIGKGAICDVHLERDGVRIACEIAVVSKVERELAHIRHCLEAKYDHVYTIFLDEKLLARTQEALATALTQDEAGKVRLVPVSSLSGIG